MFVMFGSDLVRPGLLPKANYNIGLGHTFGFLKNIPLGDELTFAYTYENGGSHGFLHTDFGAHTEAIGVMKNFALPKTKRVTGYTWIQGGITSMTGTAFVENRFYNGESLGLVVHFNNHEFLLDPRNIQQDSNDSLVYDRKHWLHTKLVASCAASFSKLDDRQPKRQHAFECRTFMPFSRLAAQT